ncbi:MAG: flagellar type III secretion system pore protein FliP [bacterium]
MKKVFLFAAAIALLAGGAAYAQTTGTALPMGIRVQLDGAGTPQETSKSIQILLMLTALSLAPSAIIMCTSFTRILIVFGFLRQAMGTQQTPPAQIMAAMSIFLTIFIMMPAWNKINEDAIKPYMAGTITQEEAFTRGVAPLRTFMGKQTGKEELKLFVELSKSKPPRSMEDVPLHVLIPAFMISELKTAYQMGFLIYLPFLVLDLVIASSLMSLGMMMLPPMMISLPVKLLFFVLADGWNLVVRGIMQSFVS